MAESYRFDGYSFNMELDGERLSKQFAKINTFMFDGEWHTLRDISKATGAPEASASARLRDLRKKKFGSHIVNKRRRDDPKKGLWEYQVVWRFDARK